jgi:hypothetical protein
MEVFAVYNGKPSKFNDKLKSLYGNDKNFIDLQIIVNYTNETSLPFDDNRFILLSIDLTKVISINSVSKITLTKGALVGNLILHKFILKDNVNGYLVGVSATDYSPQVCNTLRLSNLPALQLIETTSGLRFTTSRWPCTY